MSTGHNRRENVALHGHTKRKRDDIEQKHVRSVGRSSLARQDTCLHRRAVRNSLIGVDALLKLLSVEEVGQKLLYPWDTGATTDQHDLVNLALLNTRILEHLLNWLDCAVESLAVDVLETRTGDVGVEVLAVEERVDLNRGLCAVRKRTLGALAGCPQTTEGTCVTRDVLFEVSKMLSLYSSCRYYRLSSFYG